jgi:hypothetical protein
VYVNLKNLIQKKQLIENHLFPYVKGTQSTLTRADWSFNQTKRDLIQPHHGHHRPKVIMKNKQKTFGSIDKA